MEIGRGEPGNHARGQDARRTYRDGVARVLGRASDSIELLSPDETADLLERHAVRQKATAGRPAGSKSFAMTAREPAVIESLLHWLAGCMPQSPLVLFVGGSADHGAVCTTSTELLPAALKFVSDGRTSLLATCRDGAFGIILEAVTDCQAAPGEQFYKLVAWGVPH